MIHATTAPSPTNHALPRDSRAFVTLLIGGDKGYKFVDKLRELYGLDIQHHWERDGLRKVTAQSRPFPKSVEVIILLRTVMGHPEFYNLTDRAKKEGYRVVAMSHREGEFKTELARAGFQAKPPWLTAVRQVDEQHRQKVERDKADKAEQAKVLNEHADDEEKEDLSPFMRQKMKDARAVVEKFAIVDAAPVVASAPAIVGPVVREYPRFISPYTMGQDWAKEDDATLLLAIEGEENMEKAVEFYYHDRGHFRTSGALLQRCRWRQKRGLSLKAANPHWDRDLIRIGSAATKKRVKFLEEMNAACDAGTLATFGKYIQRELAGAYFGTWHMYKRAIELKLLKPTIDRELELYVVELDRVRHAVKELKVARTARGKGAVQLLDAHTKAERQPPKAKIEAKVEPAPPPIVDEEVPEIVVEVVEHEIVEEETAIQVAAPQAVVELPPPLPPVAEIPGLLYKSAMQALDAPEAAALRADLYSDHRAGRLTSIELAKSLAALYRKM